MSVLADVRVAARGLSRSKGFTAAGALTLGLGIAATTTIFSVVYGVLLRPLPYSDPAALVVIQGEKDFSTGPRLMNFSATEFEEFVGAARAFSSMALTARTGFTLRTPEGIESISGATVSGDFFRTMGRSPRLGRAPDAGGAPEVVISERLWRRLFGGTPDVLGRTLTLADREIVERTYTVVGVMAHEFQYPQPRTDVWRTLAFTRAMGDGNVNNRNTGGYFFVGRLRDGLDRNAAQADAERAIGVLQPHLNPGRAGLRAVVVPLAEYVSGSIGPALWILMGAVTLVLLVACTNVANLILARQATRSREVAVRMALGAPRRQLVGYLLAESAAVALCGGAIGVAVAFGAIRLLQWLQPASLPRLDVISVDLPVLLFATVTSIVTAVAAGAGPAMLATRTDVLVAMRTSARAAAGSLARRARGALVVVEVAASIVLLVGAALLARSLGAMIDTDLGVNRENVMTAQLDLALGRRLTPARQVEMADALRQRISTIPSVQSVGYGTGLPPTGEFMRVSFVLSNSANDASVSHIVTSVPTGPGYFEALQIRLLEGRLFSEADTADSAASVIVSREAARRFFGGLDPIGRTLPLGNKQMSVVGVVDNVRYTGMTSPVEGVIYLPFGQSPFPVVIMVARTSADPARIAGELRQVIRSYDPDINVVSLQPLTTWVSDAVAQPRLRAMMLGSIAVTTLALAVIGLYGVVAYATAQRVTEIGVRMAVGARPSDVARLVVRDGAALAMIGVALGMAAAYLLSSVLASFLHGVSSTDPISYTLAAAVLVPTALVASYVPARRAARIDPTVALRTE
jgi:predicted permease